MTVLFSFYRLPILVFMLFASFISCLPSEPEDEGVRAFNQHIFNLHFYNLQTEDIIEIIKSLHGQQGSVHYHGVGIGAPDSPTSSSSSSSSSTNQQPGANDNNDVIDDDDDGNGREGSVRDSNDVKVSDRQTETGVDPATLPTSSGDDGDSNNDDENSNDFTPIELTKARQKADEYVEQVRSELCPICIATVPVHDRRTSETQEAQLLQFLVRNNPSRRNRYNLFEKVRKALVSFFTLLNFFVFFFFCFFFQYKFVSKIDQNRKSFSILNLYTDYFLEYMNLYKIHVG